MNEPASMPRESQAERASHFVQMVGVVKKFGETVAVRHVDLSVRKGELFALLGSSGCGKSTLLRMLAGFESLTEGQILIDGEDMARMPPYRRPVNMMFQSYALFPHMTVENNVAFGLRQEGCDKAEIRERVAAVLELVQMTRFAKRRPNQLSGGQQQRVALARSLVKRPKLLLLDEPMSALDKQIRQRTQVELVNILDQVDVTCIMVTHDQEEAMTMADRIGVMSDGLIVQTGSPLDVYEYPSTRFAAEFIGSTNLFEGTVNESAADHVLIESAELMVPLYINHGIGSPSGAQVAVSIRPEKVVLRRSRPDAAHNWAEGAVTHVVYMGSYSLYHVVIDSGKTIVANVSSLALADMGAPEVGERVAISWNSQSGVVLTQ
ncbi:MAG: polyamine ABC transporter ATP-binding protein [Burkholderiales bacterium]|nr:polyamine ABC transporter ATP-binding protein [Burkholderiales bacterium]MDE2287998.1 polyamine ABC transporter ATP-binding protein [Burkholderiales bacterium]MDE2608045.1 polyamine ABC transporter ATP-binding protein [Burkholderiales bacterium]